MTGATGSGARWVAVDWGTTNLRVWVMDGVGNNIAHHASDRGMGRLEPDDYEPALLDLIAGHLSDDPVKIIVCGMAGAYRAWGEAGYLQTPCRSDDISRVISVKTNDPRLSVNILPGVCQISPPDVMRGEETQIAGYLGQNPDFEGAICLPGSHCKWVRISGGSIQEFQTFMTGEIFDLLSKASVLKNVVATEGWDQEVFETAVSEAKNNPGMPVAQLFSLRAAALVAGLTPGKARARLSGFLIGSEIAAAQRFWAAGKIAMIGDGPVARAYRNALELHGVAVTYSDASELTMAGLATAYSNLKVETHEP